ncbi:unnamed protein product [Danaus chrysippus]|uniref:(African queen) hypothetical protein n=1 Tax=Danaus chrysippus TaxID=151541 RepID=A0A8J2W598_9NEOP|nr:unnamed protein product [Danaus chrysippus]
MDPQELVPLESGLPRPRPSRQFSHINRSCYKGPLRICRLILLMIVLPCLFIFIPLYMRYRVFSGQIYPMGMTDMRLIDSKISPTWCQRQVVKSNATFNAFVVPGPPELMDELVPVSMVRELQLEDDMKEYWGFYLLQGSTVTVSSCVRWPGASLIMIKGYKHLQECAYIGDDSSEELDELIEAHKLGLLSNTTLLEKLTQLNKENGKANHPGTMKRHKAGVSFHDPSQSNQTMNDASSEKVPSLDITDHDPKELRAILDYLHDIREAAKIEKAKYYQPPSHLMPLPGLHRHRDTNVDRDERKWISFKDIDGNIKENVTSSSNITSTESLNTTSHQVPNEHTYKSSKNITNENSIKDETLVNKKTVLEKRNDTKEMKEDQSSKEVFENVLKQLQDLGDRGKRVLVKLHQTMAVNFNESSSDTLTGSDEELDHLRRVLVEAIDEEKTRGQRQKKRRESFVEARNKRELMLGREELKKELTEDDAARDYAAEEGLEPDGFADHHDQINETTAFDMSNSEFWSSFSSSEEALLECEGLILNLPLTPHASCTPGASEKDVMDAAAANALTYRVPANGYYFFVFNSENEVQVNHIRARFDLQKTRYEVTRAALRACTNATSRCDLPLDMFSTQKVVLELPLRNNDSLWNEQFVIISECEPRTSVYLTCAIAVPILILAFAFQ